jgi:MFS family permease
VSRAVQGRSPFCHPGCQKMESEVAFQGIGSAIIVLVALAIIGSVYKEGHHKNLAFSIYAAGAPIGFTLSAVFSALLAQFAQWPWAYYTATMVCCFLAAVAFLVVSDLRPENRRSGKRRGS